MDDDLFATIQDQLRLLHLWSSRWGSLWEKENYTEWGTLWGDEDLGPNLNQQDNIALFRAAVPYYITKNICDSLISALNTIPRDIPFKHLGILPTVPYEYGFVRLGSWLLGDVGSAGKVAFAAFAWKKFSEDVVVIVYEWRPQTITADEGLYPIFHFDFQEDLTLDKLVNTFCVTAVNPKAKQDGFDQSSVREIAQRGAMFIWSFFAFIQQTVAQISCMRPPRSFRRAFQRLELPAPDLNIVELRKTIHQKKEGDSEEVDWQYCWTVRGHWRKQWYPSDQVHRPLWINPYVKGPEDKPLKPSSNLIFTVRK